MSATEFVLSAWKNKLLEPAHAPKAWWRKVTTPCASKDCPRRGRFWPWWLHKSGGFETHGRWYCSRECLQSALSAPVHVLLSGYQFERERTHRFPIGLLLVNRGDITHGQLRAALQRQREAGHGRLGDWLQDISPLTAQQLTAALGQQWGCPVFPLEQRAPLDVWSDLIPFPLLASASAVPAFFSPEKRVLHLAFCERVDHTLLYAVEQMLQCRTVPCVATGAAVRMQLEQIRVLTSGNHTCFDTVRNSTEMTSTICNYAVELRANRVVLARAGAHIWVRFFRGHSAKDLLFRVLPKTHDTVVERSSAPPKPSGALADGRKDGVSDA